MSRKICRPCSVPAALRGWVSCVSISFAKGHQGFALRFFLKKQCDEWCELFFLTHYFTASPQATDFSFTPHPFLMTVRSVYWKPYQGHLRAVNPCLPCCHSPPGSILYSASHQTRAKSYDNSINKSNK